MLIIKPDKMFRHVRNSVMSAHYLASYCCIYVLLLYRTHYCLLIDYSTNGLYIVFSLFKFNFIFIHVKLKGNCGEDVCFNNARSTFELVNLKEDL